MTVTFWLSSVGESKIRTGWDWAAFNGVDEYGEKREKNVLNQCLN